MIKKLIFDLDGTLWKTEESYLYAYHKLKKQFHLSPLTEEQILSVLGIELADVRNIIFGKYENADELTMLALKYSIEFIKEHPHLCSNQIEYLLKKFYKDYELYILSGCPKGYLDTFLEISNISKYIKKGYSIEDGKKSDILNQLSSHEKVVYVGDSPKDYEVIINHQKVFFCYAKYGYFQADTYDCSIESLDELPKVMRDLQMKEQMLCNQPYEVISYKDSNLTLIHKENGLTYFGFLNVGKIEDFKEVLNQLKNKCSVVYGPFNGNTWYSYRIPIDSFNFNLYPDCIGNEELLSSFLDCGFSIYRTYSSTLAPIYERIWNRCKKAKLSNTFKYKVYHNKECYNHLEELYSIAIKAFQKADFYEPISFECFREIYLKNIQLAQADILMIYEEEKPIAFNFCYEDLEKRFYVCKTTAILPEYQNKNILKLLIDKSYEMMVEKGYKEVLYHFQNDRTKVLEGIFKNGIIRQKKYGVLYYENK
ncbi:MAG: GNAT family N-acetyltransferase [Roseburia sp.]|nr:GNAT family N-acetyltransferase [Anaeroplasma bactoclasticum]MCM1195546.1 GNAT family N-acetyltransferase [Roseburia sp.]MCM1555961.1 GNAT family N-acetyltransferase [Anaeroplasma bactoclasticum]